MLCYSGPLVLLRLELGVLSRGNLRPLEVVSEYIQQNDMEKVSTQIYPFLMPFSCSTVF